MARKPTGIRVRVLDLNSLAPHVIQALKDGGSYPEGATGVSTYQRYGIVDTEDGLFLLSSEGVGSSKPVTTNHKAEFDWYIESGNSFEIIPRLRSFHDDKALRDLPVLETVDLADFIREFGHRLESNFREWARFFSCTALKGDSNVAASA